MATIRVHEDQENRINDIRRGKENALPQGQALQQSKRTVLGVLQNNCHRVQKNEICKEEKHGKSKTFLSNHIEPFSIYQEKNEETAVFNIYEDKLIKETSVALRETKKQKETSVKGVAEALTKVEKEKPALDINLALVNIVQPYNHGLQKASKRQEASFVAEEYVEKCFTSLNSTKSDTRSKREAKKSFRLNFFDVDEYRADIYNYLRSAEKQHRPKPGYMKKQPDITYSMRSILIDWLVEVAEEYRLQNETLYLAVSYIDRFLSYMSVVRGKLQLVGTAAMFIAAKYEEVYPPEVGEFVYITDDTYSKKQVLKMEHLMLRVLSFDLTVPTPLAFLAYYCTSNNLSEKIRFLAMYLCELSMLEADPYLQYLPSKLAASAVALAQHTLLEEVWPHELELSSGYSLQDLKDCIIDLSKTFHNASNSAQHAIQDKYKHTKYYHVSLLLPRSSDIFDSEDGAEST